MSKPLPQRGQANWGPLLLAHLQREQAKVRILIVWAVVQALCTVLLAVAVITLAVRG